MRSALVLSCLSYLNNFQTHRLVQKVLSHGQGVNEQLALLDVGGEPAKEGARSTSPAEGERATHNPAVPAASG